jgi:hypothetical protein
MRTAAQIEQHVIFSARYAGEPAAMPLTRTGIATTADRSSAVVATIYGK